MSWYQLNSWSWDGVSSSYQNALTHWQRRFVISYIFHPMIKVKYGIQNWDDTLLDELIYWEKLPDINQLIFRNTTIKVADILVDTGVEGAFQIIQNSKRMLELIPYLRTSPSLSSAKMFLSHESFLSIYLSNTRGFGLASYCQLPNNYGFYDIVGKNLVYADLLSCHDLDDLLDTIKTYADGS